MKIKQTSVALLLVLASIVLNSAIASAEWVEIDDPAPKVFQKADLPVSGVFVPQMASIGKILWASNSEHQDFWEYL